MKNKLKKVIAIGAFVSILAVSGFAISNEKLLIHNSEQHWAQSTVNELVEKYKLDNIFGNKNLDSLINKADFKIAVQSAINEKYEGNLESLSREAIVNELVNIWGVETKTDLSKVPVFAMIFYSDEEQIAPEYNAGINIAYMKNIAKGRGDGIFAPKANVSYGELGALITKTKAAIEMEDAIAAGEFETIAKVEVKNEKAVFDFELFSHFVQKQNLIFGSGQQFEVTIEDEKANEVYKYSDGKVFTQAIIEKSIEPGESLKWQTTWDLRDKDEKLLTGGNYKAKIDILVIYEEGVIQIPEEELTKTIEFNI